MSSGITTNRDFVKGLKTQGTDWHGLTDNSYDKLTREVFPELFPVELIPNASDIANLPKDQKIGKTGLRIMVSSFDWKPIGAPFNPETFKMVHPRAGFDTVTEALEGTGYTVERMGMLWDGSVWFVSVELTELKKMARKGDKWQLNFHGGLDGSTPFAGEVNNIRIVCNNTLSMSKATGQKLFCVKQTKFSQSKIDRVKAEVERACGMAALFNEAIATLEKTPVTKDEARLAYAGILQAQGAKFARTLKAGSLEEIPGAPGTYRRTGSDEFRESRAVNMIDGPLMEAFTRGDGNKGQTRADILNGFTQVFTRGAEDSDKNPLAALKSDFSDAKGSNGTRKAEFFTLLTRPEIREGKKIVTPDGWSELITTGRKALEMAKAL